MMASEVNVNAPGEKEPSLDQDPPRVLAPGLRVPRVVVPDEQLGLLLTQEAVAVVTWPREVICLNNQRGPLWN